MRPFKRVLIVNPFGIGDALFITPMVRALKDQGAERIDLLLGSRTREVFAHHPLIGQIYEWSKDRFDLLPLIQLFWSLKRNRYDAMFDVSLGRQYSFWSWFWFGIPVRAGFNFKGRGRFLTHRMELPDGYQGKPVAEHYGDLLTLVGMTPRRPGRLEFFLSGEDHKQARLIAAEHGLSFESPYLAVVPGGGESWGKDARLKRWPVPFFAALVQDIFEEHPGFFSAVLILGGSGERALADELNRQICGITAINLCGTVSIRTAGALIEKAAFLIANDGGLVHAAHALGTPLAAFYGPVDPAVYGPYPNDPAAITITNTGPACRPCYQRMSYRGECVGVECLTTLEPPRVWALLRGHPFFQNLSERSLS